MHLQPCWSESAESCHPQLIQVQQCSLAMLPMLWGESRPATQHIPFLHFRQTLPTQADQFVLLQLVLVLCVMHCELWISPVLLAFCWKVCLTIHNPHSKQRIMFGNILKNTSLVVRIILLPKLAIYPFNFERKNGFRWQFWIFPTKPEVDFSKLIFFTNHYYQTWRCSIRILKISQ